MKIRPKDQSTTTIPTPNGITDQETKAVVKPNIGASMKIRLLDWVGIIVSFENNFRPSAIGCIIPVKPTVLGPVLIWIEPRIFRSTKVTKATEINSGIIIPNDFIFFYS